MINQDELINGTLQFIDRYKRLPYCSEDDIDVEKLNDNNEIEIKTYRALKYIKTFYTNQDKFTKHLLDSNILTTKKVADVVQISKPRLEELLTGKAEGVNPKERHMIHLFFNRDYYSIEDRLAELCEGCTKSKSCGQHYWAEVMHCKKHKAKKKKK